MNMYPILLLTACLTAGCGGAGGSESAAEGTTPAGTDERKPTATVYNETRTVSLNDPYMQNAQVLTIECLPGWQLVGKVDMEDFQQANGTPNAQIKGSDGARQLGFYTEMARSYYCPDTRCQGGCGGNRLCHQAGGRQESVPRGNGLLLHPRRADALRHDAHHRPPYVGRA